MSADSARLFAENREQVMTPILPADQNGPTQNININLGASFGRAANNGPYSQPAPAQQNTAQGPSMEDKQRLANDAIGVGQTLQNPGEGIAAKQSDAVYLGKQMLQGLSQVGGGVLGILSDEHKGNQAKGPSPDDTPDIKPVMAPPAPQFTSSSPGFGGGPG